MSGVKQFERLDYGGAEVIRRTARSSSARAEKGEGFQEFFDQLPEPRDKEAVQQWLRTKIPVGMPAEEAQVFLLLGGFSSSEWFPSHGASPATSRPVPSKWADKRNVIHFHAKYETRGWVMPYECSVKVKYDLEGRVTEVMVEEAKRYSKWGLLLVPLLPH